MTGDPPTGEGFLDKDAVAEGRLAFLVDASAALADTTDERSALVKVAHLVVPALADWCSVHVRESDGSVRRLAVVHSDPERAELVARLAEDTPIDPAAEMGLSRVLETGQPELFEDVDQELIERLAKDDEQADLYRQLGCRSALAVPFVARGRVLGAIGLVQGDSGRRFDSGDMTFLEELARRCAAVIDTAELHREALDRALDLDRSLALLDALLGNAPLALGLLDPTLRFARVNGLLAELAARPAEELLGLTPGEALAAIDGKLDETLRRVAEKGKPIAGVPLEMGDADGAARSWLAAAFPVLGTDAVFLGAGLIIVEVTTAKATEAELDRKVREQASVAEIAQRALAGARLESLFGDAAELVAATLDVDLVEICEAQPGGEHLRLVSGWGWPEGLVGTAVIDAGPRSHAGYTLHSNSVVVLDDLETESRFVPSWLLVEHGVVSGLAVAIEGAEADYGVLAVHTRHHRTFTDDDTVFLRSITAVLGTAVQRRQAESEVRESRRRLQFALEAGRMGTWEWDLTTDRLHWSETMETIFGLPHGGFGGTFDDYLRLLYPGGEDEARERLRRIVHEDGEHFVEHSVKLPNGDVRWVEGRGQVIHDADGRPVAMMGVSIDVTDRKGVEERLAALLEQEREARAEGDEAREWLSFLEQASAILNADLDVDRSIADLSRLVVPRLADWCTVELVEQGGRLRQVASVHVDPNKVELARELRRRYPPQPDAPGPATVIRTRRPQMVQDVTEDILQVSARDDEHLEMIRALGPRSAMTVPLTARGRALGSISLVMAESGRRFEEQDLAFAESLAARAAIALDNARLFEERSKVARTLQQALLPPELPDIPGLELAARYEAAGEGIEIGGDFYDVFETADGAWAVVIGDVCGKGTEAAVLTGLVRHTVRAAATRNRTPASVLSVVNEAITEQIEETRFCTVGYLRVQPGDGAATVVCAAAGHPPPLRVGVDGEVAAVPCQGAILGAFASVELNEASCDLGPGDALVLFTDGVLEARNDGEVFGDDRVHDLLTTVAGATADEIADALVAAVTEFDQGVGRDDVAVLVLRVPN